MSIIRVAYIGCGAVVQHKHLPALQRTPAMLATVLVDVDKNKREDLAREYKVAKTASSYLDFLDEFDLAVVATPSASHFELTRQLLDHGKHVLVEKPLATNHADALALVECSEKQQRVVAVSLVRRYLPNFILFKSLLDASIVGSVSKFEMQEGSVFNWPVQSADFYDPVKSAGGVLIDNGSHLLDLLIWWLGDFITVNYQDDAMGGVEADCDLQIELVSGAVGSVKMSRLRSLKNAVTVDGDRGRLAMDLVTGEISFTPNDSQHALAGVAQIEQSSTTVSTIDLFVAQYQGLCSALNGSVEEQQTIVSARRCLNSIRMIEQCYKTRPNLANHGW